MKRPDVASAFALVAGLGLLLTPSSARADDADDLRALLDESVVTTASKAAQREATVPALTTTVTGADLSRYGIHSLDEAIDFLSAGVYTSNPLRQVDVGARGVILRGDQGSHMLLLVNGHAVNEPLYGAARFERGAGIPLELVDRIEVIVGPGSVLYGSNAMLGVINVITKSARDFEGGHFVAETEVGKSYRGAAGAGYRFPVLGTPSELTFEAEYYRQSGPTFTFGPQQLGVDKVSGQPFTFTRDGRTTGSWGGAASRSYTTFVPALQMRFSSGNLEVNFHASAYQRRTPYTAVFSDVYGDFDSPDNLETDRSLWLDAKYRIVLSPVTQVSVRGYADTFDYQHSFTTTTAEGCIYANTSACRTSTVGTSRWGGAEVQASMNWLLDGSLVTLVGVDGRGRRVEAKTDLQDTGTARYLRSSYGVVRGTDVVLAGYAQQTWDPSRLFSLNGGVRIDKFDGYAAVASPRAAVASSPWTGGTLKAIYSEAFRAPSPDERFGESSDRVRADALDKETVRAVELQVEQKVWRQRALASFYYASWKNMVETATLTQAQRDQLSAQGKLDQLSASGYTQYRNVASIEDLGVTGVLDGVLIERLRWGASATVSQARRQADGVDRDVVIAPHVFGNARVSYELGGALPTLAIAGRYLGRRPVTRAYDSFFDTPFAPALAEIRATVSGPFPAVKGLSYRLSADVVTASTGPYVVGPAQHGPNNEFLAVPKPELNPVDTFRATIGLRYELSP
jgi:outer membrane receptor protein involved in Fe transport